MFARQDKREDEGIPELFLEWRLRKDVVMFAAAAWSARTDRRASCLALLTRWESSELV